MDLIATRELARIQSVLNLLRMQRAELSELSDIQAFRSLEETYRDALEEAQKLGKAPADPVAEVRADWLRLVRWSNQVQAALREADELGEELTAAGAPTEKKIRKQKRAEAPGKPGLANLLSLEQKLKEAPTRLENLLLKARAEVKESDWQGDLPYAELTDVADAMGWNEAVVLAEAPGKWTEGVSLRARPLVASRKVVEPGNPMLGCRLSELHRKSNEVRALVEKHAFHAARLVEINRLIDAGEMETASRFLAGIEPRFADLEYDLAEKALEKDDSKELEALAFQAMVRVSDAANTLAKASFFSRSSARDGMQNALSNLGNVQSKLRQAVSEKAGRESEHLLNKWIKRLERLLSGGMASDWIALFTEIKNLKNENPWAAEAVLCSKLGVTPLFKAGFRGQFGKIGARWIPAGHFIMGSPDSEKGRDSGERQHKVVISRGFFLAETECTQEQWGALMQGNPSLFKGSDRPVETVSWDEAVKYCRKLTAEQHQEGILPDGWEWRLPTEAEWEYACRAGTTGARYAEPLDDIAWWSGNSHVVDP